MKIYIKEIGCCMNCPFAIWELLNKYGKCSETGKEIVFDRYIIPDFCPLPDKKE